MGKIALLLRDLPADKGSHRASVRTLLSKEQWDEILEADARGVSPRAIFAALSGTIAGFPYTSAKQLASGIFAERKSRRIVGGKK